MPKNRIAASKKEWNEMVRADWQKWESNCHPEDSIPYHEWISSMTDEVVYGWLVFKTQGGYEHDIEKV